MAMNLLVAVLLSTHVIASESRPSAETRPSTAPSVVATVLGRPVSADEIEPPADWKAKRAAELEPRAYAAWLDGERRTRLSKRICEPLIERYVQHHRLEPTPDELRTAADAFHRKMKATHQDHLERRQDVERRLSSEELSPEEKDRLERQLDTLNSIIEMDQPKIADGLARMMVGPWKLNKSLHEKYGGTVIWQQAGVEAVGAMRTWLEEQQKSGDFDIHDPPLRRAFWEYYVREHPFEIKRSNPFDTPPWLEDSESATQPAQ